MLDLEQTKKILKENKILPRQSLGQNFLVSKQIIERTIAISGLSAKDTVLEIGPGLGSLTAGILETGAKVIAIEIDQQMVSILRQRFKESKNFILVQQDILKTNLTKLFSPAEFYPDKNLKIIANLPYYISAEIIEQLICELPFSQSMSLMLQKEAIERITLKPNDSRYGPTAILLELYGKITDRINVPPHYFFPQPKVSSQVIVFARHPDSVLLAYSADRIPSNRQQGAQVENGLTKTDQVQEKFVSELDSFKFFLNNCFAHRRKTLRNNLKNYLKNYSQSNLAGISPGVKTVGNREDRGHLQISIDAELEQLTAQIGVDLNSRPEQISAGKFWQLFQSVANYMSKVNGGME